MYEVIVILATFALLTVSGQVPEDTSFPDENAVPLPGSPTSPYEFDFVYRYFYAHVGVGPCYNFRLNRDDCIGYRCPRRCDSWCWIHCPTCKTSCNFCAHPGSGCHDPRFVGGDGNTFLFHGRRDHDFCLISDSNLHINAHFIGKRALNSTHDFTWIQALGVMFNHHRLYIGVQKTPIWNNDVDRLVITFDGESIHLAEETGAMWRSDVESALSITRAKPVNGIIVQLKERFRVTISAEPVTEEDSRIHNYGLSEGDSLAHLNVGFKFFALTSNVHGVLGQTYRPDYVSKVDIGKKIPVLGGEFFFVTSDIFSIDCKVSRFEQSDDENGIAEITEQPDTICTSGGVGIGLVCKK